MTTPHKVVVTLSLSLLLGATSFAQQSEKRWLDNSLSECKKSKATHYLLLGEKTDNAYPVTLHRLDGSLKMEGKSKHEDGSVLDGPTTFYHPDGKPESKGVYLKGDKVGIWERWDKQGKALAERSYASFDHETLAYTYVDIMPYFEGGEEKFHQLLQHRIGSCVTEHRLGEKEFEISFVISEEGDIQNMTMMDGDELIANERLNRVYRELPNWVPGQQQGRAVRVLLTMPIRL